MLTQFLPTKKRHKKRNRSKMENSVQQMRINIYVHRKLCATDGLSNKNAINESHTKLEMIRKTKSKGTTTETEPQKRWWRRRRKSDRINTEQQIKRLN